MTKHAASRTNSNKAGGYIIATAIAMALLFFNSSLFAQSGQKFASGGNTLSGNEFFGTLNNFPINVKVNNTLQSSFTPTGFDVYGNIHSTKNTLVDSVLQSWNAIITNALSVGGSITLGSNVAMKHSSSAASLSFDAFGNSNVIGLGYNITTPSAAQGLVVIPPGNSQYPNGGVLLGDVNPNGEILITLNGNAGGRLNIRGWEKKTYLVNDGGEKITLDGVNGNSLWETTQGLNLATRSGTTFSGNYHLNIAGKLNAQQYFQNDTLVDLVGMQTSVGKQQTAIDNLQLTVGNIQPSQWTNIGLNSISYSGNATVNGTFQATAINTSQLSITDKFTAPKAEVDTLHAIKSIEVNNSLKLLRDNAETYAEVSTKDTAVALMLQKEPEKQIIIGDGPIIAPPPGESRDKLTVIGNTRISGNINSSGNITASCVNTGCLNVSGQTSFDSLHVNQKIKVGNSTYIDASGFENNIYTDNGNLLLNSNPAYNYHTILNYGTSGNVGIGTKNPSEKLEVKGGNIRVDDSYDLLLRNSHHGLGWYGGDGITPLKKFDGANIDGPVLYGYSGGALGVYNDNGQKVALRWDASGNVGIGTDNPHCKLSIRGDYNAMCIESESPNSGYSDLVFKEGADPVYRNWIFRAHTSYNTTTPRAFEISSVNSGSELYMVGPYTSDIKVGIGTKYIPGGYILSVGGAMFVKKVRVESGWSDFVFDENHKRKSIEEKENFYKTNKHLPNIPTAKEIETDGLDVGDVMSGMMQEAEETRLDITELYKRLLKLEKENEKLKMEMEKTKEKK